LTAVISTVDQAIKGFGYKNSSSVTSNTILSAMLTGVIGTFVFSSILKKTNAYKLITSISINTIIQLLLEASLIWFLSLLFSHMPFKTKSLFQ
jgi:hypothetical protein